MADTATSIPLPPPEPTAMQPSAPGTAPVVEGNLPSSAAQLPPAPPALAIPPNTNPIPTAITSPQSIPAAANGGDVMTPVTAGGAANVGRRPQVKSGNRTLYVGGLPGNCTEEQLTKIFGSLNKGSVASVKLIPDKNVHSKGLYYGFVEFDDPAAAEHAMLIMNGRKIYEREIRINWAYQTNTTHKEDTSSHFHIFVGDLSNEVTDEALLQAFQTFGDVSEARVMWDMKTGRTRGYGFVAYRSQEGAVRAISEMDGEWLGSRQIRVNWANQKGQPSMAQSQAMAHAGVMPAGMPAYGQTMIDPAKQQANYTTVYNGAPMNVVTVYVGNLTPFTTNQDLHPLFSNFGNIVEIRYQQDRGYAFIKYGTHDEAATAILNLNSYVLNGRPLKCSWGRDRQSDRNPTGGPHSGGAPPSAGPHPGYGYDSSAFPQSAPNSAYPHTPAGPYPPYGVNYPGNPMSPQGHTPGGPHYAPPPGAAQAPYTPMSGGPATAGAYGGHAGDARGSQQWAPQPGAYPPQTAQPPYGGYHG